jgi:prepilin-type N-terminal cleavage/methylation domain-containing protein
MKKRGFTLVEIMIVVAIIGLLAAIAIPSFSKIRSESRKSTCQNSQRLVRDAIEQWAMANNIAEDGAITGAGVTNVISYLKSGLPYCPEGHVVFALPANVGDAVTCPVSGSGHSL